MRSPAASRDCCCGLSFSRDTGPFDLSASVPPSRQARCHRRTGPLGDPQVMRDLADLAAAGEPLRSLQPHLLAPPLPAGGVPAPLRIPRSYARSQPTSRSELYEFSLGKPTTSTKKHSERCPGRAYLSVLTTRGEQGAVQLGVSKVTRVGFCRLGLVGLGIPGREVRLPAAVIRRAFVRFESGSRRRISG